HRLDLEQIRFLVFYQLGDDAHVLVRELVELSLSPVCLVLTQITRLDGHYECDNGATTHTADRDTAVLGLGTRDLDVLLAAFLGQLGKDHTDDLAVVGRVDPQVTVADRVDDRGACVDVER